MKGVPAEIRDRQDATSRFLIAALLLHNESVRTIIRRELRKVVDVNVTEQEVLAVLEAEVLKRDSLEGPAAEKAVDQVKRAQKAAQKAKPVKSPTATAEADLVDVPEASVADEPVSASPPPTDELPA